MLGNLKDKDPKNNQTGIIYHYKCPQINFPSAYLGESERSLGERVKEHLKAPSPIHLHSTTTGHPMDPEQFSIVHKEVSRFQDHQRGHVHPGTGSNTQQEPREVPTTSHLGPPLNGITNPACKSSSIPTIPPHLIHPLLVPSSPTLQVGTYTFMVSTHVWPKYTPYTPKTPQIIKLHPIYSSTILVSFSYFYLLD